MKIYCLSGLGADKKAFQYLTIENAELIHIEWIDPLPHESLENYAQRLFEINIKDEQYNLMGLSFGGMLAQEFSKLQTPKNLILISTISSRKDLPTFLKIAGAIKLHRIIPNRLIKSVNFITRYLFGTQDPKVDKLFRQIQKDTDPSYVKWAIDAILSWNNKQQINSIRLHGDNDKLLPLKYKVDNQIKTGGHLMLIDHAAEVSSIINKQLIK